MSTTMLMCFFVWAGSILRWTTKERWIWCEAQWSAPSAVAEVWFSIPKSTYSFTHSPLISQHCHLKAGPQITQPQTPRRSPIVPSHTSNTQMYPDGTIQSLMVIVVLLRDSHTIWCCEKQVSKAHRGRVFGNIVSRPYCPIRTAVRVHPLSHALLLCGDDQRCLWGME